MTANGEVERPAEASGRPQIERSSSVASDAAALAPRAHNILPRPRRLPDHVSRTPPTIVRCHGDHSLPSFHAARNNPEQWMRLELRDAPPQTVQLRTTCSKLP